MAESCVDPLREGLSQGMNADFGRCSRDSSGSESPLDRPPARRLGEAGSRPSSGKEISARRLVEQGIEVFLEGSGRLRVQRHVIPGAPALGRATPDADSVLHFARDRHITNAQAQHAGQSQAGAKAEHNQGAFPAPSRGGEKIEKARNFRVRERAATAHGDSGVLLNLGSSFQQPDRAKALSQARPSSSSPDYHAPFPDKDCVPFPVAHSP